MDEPPMDTVAGDVDRFTVGVGGDPTITVTEAETVPPAPVQSSVKVALALSTAVASVPLAAFEPLQLPEAVHNVASVVPQMRVVVSPAITLADADVSVTVGASGASAGIVDTGCTPFVQATNIMVASRVVLRALLNIMWFRSGYSSEDYKRLKTIVLFGKSLPCR